MFPQCYLYCVTHPNYCCYYYCYCSTIKLKITLPLHLYITFHDVALKIVEPQLFNTGDARSGGIDAGVLRSLQQGSPRLAGEKTSGQLARRGLMTFPAISDDVWPSATFHDTWGGLQTDPDRPTSDLCDCVILWLNIMWSVWPIGPFCTVGCWPIWSAFSRETVRGGVLTCMMGSFI